MNQPAQARGDVAEAVQRVVRNSIGGHGSLPLDARLLADLGLDSVALVVTIFDLSEDLGIEMADIQLEAFTAIHSIEDLIRFFQDLLG
jgi:acyl carrier protein